MKPGGTADSWTFDHNAGGPPDAEVLACFVEVQRSVPANPASQHAPGRRARAVLEDARARIAAALGLGADDVVFTSGGTEAANLAVAGLGVPELPVLLSAAEHPAVLEPAQRRGCRWWGVTADGAACVEPPREPVGLLALVHAQGEVGTLQPVAAATALAHQLRVPLVIDLAQSLGRVPIDGLLVPGTVALVAPHKCGGLRGHGVVAGAGLVDHLRAQQLGGAQEHGRRAGTQSPALAAANALAVERAVAHCRARGAAMLAVRTAFVDTLLASAAACVLVTPLANSVPNTVMLRFPGIDGRNLLPALDLAGVHASHGSACSSGAAVPPRILLALGLDEAAARTCVRFSFAGDEPLAHVQRGAQRTAEVVARLQKKK
ncbi:MAG: aminotransferase class V-fold PLP-dependent enzyme [Planctomycetes bacterium]|nr:aminotransferase class V-fold PLP-dependent enzyme [Planctomycetota bacterium]